jgi:glycosyltransferase involved in cell wall biosynthesis
MSSPRVVIGAPVFNHEQEFREAIESILAQTFTNFGLVIVDDCSTDATDALARDYATADPRVVYVRNPQRLGMIGNWRRAFELGLERWPDAEYFAWASDHDLWHPRWLGRLVAALDATPNAVLAYPFNSRVGPNSELTAKRPWKFETRGIASRSRRFRLALRNMSAGNMIYGLARAKDVNACGVFRHVLVPDRLLIMELALRGEFLQVPEVLWFRRWYGPIFSLGRQRRAFFPNGRPLYAMVPWWISHASVLGWLYGIQGQAAPAISRWQGLSMSVAYFFLAGLLHLRQQLKQLRVDTLERAQFLKPAYNAVRKLGRRISKRSGLGDALRTTQKNLTDASRRQRMRAKAVKQVRRQSLALAAGGSRLAARTLRSMPGVGPHVLPWLLREQLQMSTGAVESLRLQRLVEQLKRTPDPVVFGPFLAGPEFELLYWIPFLRWLQIAAALDPARCVVVCRPGAAAWYEGIGAVRQPAAPDAPAGAGNGRGKSVVVHPDEMQQLFRHVWQDTAPRDLLARHVVHRRLSAPSLPSSLRLPADYTAVRFAFDASFPDTPENRGTAQAMIEALAVRRPVVLLGPELNVDDLHSYDPGPMPNLLRADRMSDDSLAAVTAIVANASAFAGSFGACSCLAATYGVPGVSVYGSRPDVTTAMIEELRRMAAALDGSAVVIRADALATLTLGAATSRPEPAFHGPH